MWHAAAQMSTLSTGLSLKETVQGGGGQGDVHRARSLGKLMNLAWRYLVYADSLGETPGNGNEGLVRLCPPRVMLPINNLIDVDFLCTHLAVWAAFMYCLETEVCDDYAVGSVQHKISDSKARTLK